MTRAVFDHAALAAAYADTGNVHRAAERVGISHSVAHRALTKAGLMRSVNVLRPDEIARIRDAYEATVGNPLDLKALSVEMGRTRAVICRAASEMGLSAPSRPKATQHAAALKAGNAKMNARGDHPKGFSGGSHTDAAKETIGKKSRDAWLVAKTFNVGLMSEEQQQRRSDHATARMALSTGENAYSRAKGGRRADIGPMYFRSAWEANYARYLNWLLERGEIDGWEYEPETFWFEAIKRGVRSYKPDFRISEKGQSYFVEVKGWMDPKSKTKLQRMKKYHPTVEVRLVDAKQYESIKRAVSRLIPTWEGAK